MRLAGWRRWPGTAVWVAALAASLAGVSQSSDTESQRFAAFLQRVYESELAASPQLATEVGSRLGDDRWDDLSQRALAARAAEVRAEIDAAKTGFAYKRLDDAAQLQYRVFLDEERLLLERYRWRDHLYPLNQIVGLHIDVPGLLTGAQKLDDERDALHYVERIRAVAGAFRALESNMRIQVGKGIYMPKSVYPLLIDQARGVISGAPFDAGPDCAVLADFKRRSARLDLPAARRASLVAAASAALRRDLQPAYEELIRFLQDQALRTPIDGGVWQLPDGDAFYAFLIRQFTTTDMTPAQIHELGLAEVARLHGEIAALMRRIGFQGSLRDFMAGAKADPRQFVSNDEAGRAAYLERARAIVAAMQAKLTEAFAAPAPLPLRIERTESYKEASSPPGFYEPGSADGRRPGTVYLNLANMRVMPLYELEDLLYHEGVPGHHLQISTILVDASIPETRKVNEWWQDSAFVEGWGLYAERLGKELGFYQDPHSEFGLLAGELWRATRLVVDSGLHYKRWTRRQAIDYLNENTPSPEETNERAVDRYLAVPGQATSFMVGMHRFVTERERARRALGERFDLREYHRVALSSGYIPLWALDEKISAWIRARNAAPGSAAVDPAPNAAFERMLQEYWREYLDLNPQLALSQGEPAAETRFDDSLTDDWRIRTLAMLDRYLQASARFQSAALTPSERTSLAMLTDQLTRAREYYAGAAFETARRLPIDQFQGRHSQFAADAAGAGDYPFKTITDYERALERAEAYARWTNQAIARLREGAAAGVVLPRLVVERILPQLRVHFGTAAAGTEFWRPVAAMPDSIPQKDRARLQARYRRCIDAVIEPAYRRLHDFLQNEYLPRARASVGLGAIPGGADLYGYLVRAHTTTDLTPAEIHALGMQEVAHVEAQFAAVQAALGMQGSLQDFFAKVRADDAQKFADRSQIVPAFEAARRRIEGKLPLLFDVMPRAEFQIRALPQSARQSPGNGYYSPAAADGSRPGILWINTYAPGVQDRFNVVTIMLHEGLPGHHFQTSIAQERADLPAFRRADFNDAYGEGWALYAESLGEEMRLYQDPWSAYGHLNYSILRANRLVIDTGLHALGWDVETGVRWMMQHSSMTRDQATAEVERYVAYPGQALAYKIGEMKIQELRRRAQRELGEKFDIREFHDRILQGGSLPLTILEKSVDGWLSAARAR